MYVNALRITAVLTAAISASPASAATSVFTRSDFSYVFVPKFDPRLGSLTGVTFENSYAVRQGFLENTAPLVRVIGTLGRPESGIVAVDEDVQSYATGAEDPPIAAISITKAVSVTFTADLAGYVAGSDRFGGTDFLLVGVFDPLTIILPNGAVALQGFGRDLYTVVDTRVTYTYDAVAVIPEPASWVMMLTGFGLAAASLRTRRRDVAAVGA